MTFEEWLKHEKLRYGIYAIDNSTTLLRDAWDAALASENEACAKIADEMWDGGDYIRARREP